MSRIELNKKQVGALLKVISKDAMRPEPLRCLYIDRHGDDVVAVATDGYIMSVLKLDTEDAEPIVGKLIRRDAIERWYKLATGKSRLDTNELIRVSADDYAQNGSYVDGKYPEWQRILPTGEPEGAMQLAFNADFGKVLQELENTDAFEWTVYGKLKPMVTTTEVGTYIMMPRKL